MAFIKMSSFKLVNKLSGDEFVIGLTDDNIKFSIQLLKSFFTSISQLATKPTVNPTDIVGISDSDGNIVYKTTIKDLVLNSGVSFDNDNFKGSFAFDDAAPLNPDNKAIWGFASNPTDEEQIFVNFGNTPVPANTIGIMSYNGTQWKYQQIDVDLSAYALSGGSIKTVQQIDDEKIAIDYLLTPEVGTNLFDKSTAIDGYYIDNTLGELHANVGSVISDWIPIDDTKLYSISGRYSSTGRFRNANGDILKGLGNDGQPLPNYQLALEGVLIPPAGATDIQLTIVLAGNGDTNTAQLQEGELITEYEPYSLKQVVKDEHMSRKYLTIDDVKIGTRLKTGKNIFNKATVIPNYYIQSSTGNLYFNAGSSVSDWMPISADEVYKMSGVSSGTTYRFRNASQQILKPVNANGEEYPTWGLGGLITGGIIYVPPTAVELQVTTQLTNPTDLDTIQIEAGSVPTSYEPYEQSKVVDTINDFPIEAEFLKKGATLDGKEIATTDMLTTQINSFNLATIDAIYFFGCSYTESYYALMNKSWVNKLANLTQWNCYNQGVSGNRIIDELDRFRRNTAVYGTSPQNLKGKIIWLGNIGNETLFDYNLDVYLDQMRSFILFAKSEGALVILSTDHTLRDTPQIESAIAEMAREYGCYFFPSGDVGDQILNSRYPGFYGGAHPATRTNTHQYLTQFYFLNMIRRPMKAIKIFRKRSQFTVTDVNQLNYDNELERIKKFVSLNVGERSLNEADTSYQYMDNLANTSLYNAPSRLNEYTRLANGNMVNFPDYALIEIVLDKIKMDSLKLSIQGEDDGRTFYIRNNKSSATWEDSSRYATAFNVSKAVYDAVNITAGDTYSNTSVKVGTELAPLTYTGKTYDYRLGYLLCFDHATNATVSNQAAGQLIQITGSGDSSIDTLSHDSNLRYSYSFFNQLGQPEGAFEAVTFNFGTNGFEHTFNKSDLIKYMSYDKVVLLVHNDIAFNMGNINCEYIGGVEKEVFDRLHLPEGGGAPLIDEKVFDAAGTGWDIDAGGTIEQIPAQYENYPDIAGGTTTHHVELGFDAENAPIKLRKQIVSPAEITGYRRLTVRVVNRLFPKIYTPSGSNTDYTTTNREITPDSYDDGTLCVAIKGATGGESVSRQPIGIGWNMATFEIVIPASLGDFELQVYRDPADIVQSASYLNHTFPLQIVYVDAKIK